MCNSRVEVLFSNWDNRNRKDSKIKIKFYLCKYWSCHLIPIPCLGRKEADRQISPTHPPTPPPSSFLVEEFSVVGMFFFAYPCTVSTEVNKSFNRRPDLTSVFFLTLSPTSCFILQLISTLLLSKRNGIVSQRIFLTISFVKGFYHQVWEVNNVCKINKTAISLSGILKFIPLRVSL